MPQPSARRADAFLLPGVTEAYRARPPYPQEVIDRLVDLAGGGRMLDLGAGEGSIARRLVGRVSAVVAVERSAPMIEVGRTLPGGAAVTWHREPAERFTATGPFDLAVVGEAMHWFDLPAVIGRLRDVLHPSAPLALVERSTRHGRMPEIIEVIQRFSTAENYDPAYDVADDLVGRGLWTPIGALTPPVREFRQSPEDYLTSLRSTSSLARALMAPEDNVAFDAAVLDVVRSIADADGMLTLEVTARLAWGKLGMALTPDPARARAAPPGCGHGRPAWPAPSTRGS